MAEDQADTSRAAAASGLGCGAEGAQTVVGVVEGAVVGAGRVVVVAAPPGCDVGDELPHDATMSAAAKAPGMQHHFTARVSRMGVSPCHRAMICPVYDALVAAHVVCAVVGFGSVALSGVYGGFARKAGSGEDTTRYFASRGWAEWLVLAVPFLGGAALALKPEKGDLADVWVIGGIVIWVAAAVLLVGVVRPSEAGIRRGTDRAGCGRRLMWSSVAMDALFVVALGIMVTQPK